MALKKTFSHTGATKANKRTSRCLARRGPSCVFVCSKRRHDRWRSSEKGEIWRIDTSVRQHRRINQVMEKKKCKCKYFWIYFGSICQELIFQATETMRKTHQRPPCILLEQRGRRRRSVTKDHFTDGALVLLPTALQIARLK